MKTLFLIIIILLVSNLTFSQIGIGGTPPSFSDNNLTKEISTYTLSDFNIDKIIKEDTESANKGDRYRYAFDVEVNLNTANSGSWSKLSDGRKIWRLKINANNSQAVGLYYSKFNIPIGGLLFIYSENKKQIIGAFNHTTNKKNQEFATELIMGNNVILEYIAPEFNTKHPEINISSVSYAYRNVNHIKNTEKEIYASGACEVNVKCPEGDNWQDQIRGVARISLKIGNGYYWCSGSLVNNTNQNCEPYFLSAYHCGEGASTADINQWVFYFNYESNTCIGTTASESYTVTGATLKAEAENTTGTYSDMLLVILNQDVPSSYNPYYNAWNRSTIASASGVGIHHPVGDIKKISTYTSQLTNYNSTHWETYWSATTTNHGVTEQGSSGSPIFNSSGEIIGTLSAGTASCSNLTGYDIYGKFYYHWESNGSTSSKQLKPWLDPAGTNPIKLAGKNADCSTTPSNNCQKLNYPLIGTQLYSYINGNNSYGDKVKANKYTTPAGLKYITEVDVAFTYITGNAFATLAIWEDNITTGLPNNTYLASTTINTNTIINDINSGNITKFTFANAVEVSGDFFVGIILPTVTGDTLVLISNSDNDTNPGIAWEQWSDNSWHQYSAANSWNSNIALAIYPSICKFPLSVNDNKVIDIIKVYPNPTKNLINIELENANNQNTSVYLYNIYGEILNINVNKTSTGLIVSLKDLPKGVYFINILNNKQSYKAKVLLVD